MAEPKANESSWASRSGIRSSGSLSPPAQVVQPLDFLLFYQDKYSSRDEKDKLGPETEAGNGERRDDAGARGQKVQWK